MRDCLRPRRGQALVEFALILPILLLLLLGILEFGRAWNTKQALTNAAREGARLAVLANATTTQAQVTTRVRTSAKSAGIDSTQVTVTYPDGFKTGTGNITSVEVTLPFRFSVLHRLAALVTTNGVMTLRTTARMRNE